MNSIDNREGFCKKYLFFILAAVIAVVSDIIIAYFFDGYCYELVLCYSRYIDESIFCGFIMFIIGMTMTKNDFIVAFKKVKEIILGVVISIAAIFFIAFITSRFEYVYDSVSLIFINILTLLEFSTTMIIFAVIIMCFVAKADVALAIIYMTLLGFLASFLYFGEYCENVYIGEYFTSIIFMYVKAILAPIILGIVANTLFYRVLQKYDRVLSFIINLSAVFFTVSISKLSRSGIDGISSLLTSALLVAGFSIWAYFCSFLIGRLIGFDREAKKTLFILISIINNIAILWYLWYSEGANFMGMLFIFFITSYWGNKAVATGGNEPFYDEDGKHQDDIGQNDVIRDKYKNFANKANRRV